MKDCNVRSGVAFCSSDKKLDEDMHNERELVQYVVVPVQRMSTCPALIAGVDDRITDRQSRIGAAFHSEQRAKR